MTCISSTMRVAAVASIVLAGVSAQSQTATEQEAQRAQRELQQNRSEIDRLIDLRLRHDLGLPTGASERTFRSDVPSTPVAMEQMGRQLREEDAATASIRQRFEQLREAADKLREEAEAEQAAREAAERPFVIVPTSGSTMPRAPRTSDPSSAAASEGQSPAPAGESSRKSVSEQVAQALRLGPPRAQIHGSTDHERVAQALFKAGQVLLDRGELARQQGLIDLGRQFDDEAKERLQRAVDELAPLLEKPEPSYVALFHLARCRELLFRYSERHEGLSLAAKPRDYQQREQLVREPFLAITARDVVKSGDRSEIESPGPWGQAAQTAMEHFRWMNQYSGYDASAAIEALTWPGEKPQ